MSTKTNAKTIRLDPRTELLLLVIANVVAFTYSARWIEFAVIGALALLLIVCGYAKTAVKWILFFSALVLFQYYVIPVLPKALVVMFMVLAVYLRKIFPCVMIGALIIKSTPVRFLIIALQKWNVPQKLIIPLSITLRYFPAISEEYRHIRDAMKLRKIRGLAKKLECTVVPLLMSATGTADELSAAAITRGIENPVKKTCVIDLRFHVQDMICLLIGGLFIIAALFAR
ncbi:energy-coupling factor transporter transmembrane component T [Lachnospiraceae bacterium 54-53]